MRTTLASSSFSSAVHARPFGEFGSRAATVDAASTDFEEYPLLRSGALGRACSRSSRRRLPVGEGAAAGPGSGWVRILDASTTSMELLTPRIPAYRLRHSGQSGARSAHQLSRHSLPRRVEIVVSVHRCACTLGSRKEWVDAGHGQWHLSVPDACKMRAARGTSAECTLCGLQPVYTRASFSC